MIHKLTMDMSIKLGNTYIVSYACNLLLTISSQATICDWILENLPSTHKRQTKQLQVFHQA